MITESQGQKPVNEFDTAQYRKILRGAGLKATPSRAEILDFLNQTKNPLAAQEVIDAFAGKIDQATIYRMLKQFKHRGIIRQVDMRHNHAHYELARDNDDHHHLICTHCERVEDIEGCEVEEMYGAILRSHRRFASIGQHSLEFYGLCRQCDVSDQGAHVRAS
jgi:Fur family ferric uptake transcriptional regulator